MTIRNLITDLFGRKARADLAKKYNEATHLIQHLEGCKATLTEINGKHVESLKEASVRLAGGGHQHRLIRHVLVEELARAVYDSLAAKWAMDLADELAVKTGLDIRGDMQSRINEMTGAHTMPRPDLVDGPDARQHPADDSAEPAETGEDGEAVADTDQDTQEIEVAT